ncbi:MAG: excinuclease ABC subunit UvrB [Candidatus Brocadiae bacterium]|nr:excinuclease ABC subunit UvrB [Candidatus Brocadiia bacterium]
MAKFLLKSDWQPKGDQPKAIEALVKAYREGKKQQTLLGVTGSGKTFVMANVIAELGVPALVMSPNKTLAAQLYSEFKNFFPENAVEYFISYYDFYQPEAYIPQRDIYIEKDASVNEQIDRMRMAATSALFDRDDVIIVASVSCIYSLGDPRDYKEMVLNLRVEKDYKREFILRRLIEMQYTRNDFEMDRSRFRVRGDVIEIWPSYLQMILRLEFFGDLLERMEWCDPVSGEKKEKISNITVYPAKHYVMPQEKIEEAMASIHAEMEERVAWLKEHGKIVEASRLETRTHYDLEMMQEVGFCSGIENYSRHFAKRAAGERPYCLLDYFPESFLTIVDESHVAMSQIRGMHAGDHARKSTLVEHGFRLPSAVDNRPNRLDEWEKVVDKVMFVSATPAEYELSHCELPVVELLVRPTGLVDPCIEVHSAQNQVEHLLSLIQEKSALNERVLVTTLTKRLAEDLSEYLKEKGLKVSYLHCENDAFERVEILQDLRRGKYDAVIGINLLREGLDLPEVSLVAILDADREGFLRSETSLIQTIGRSARNVNAKVVLYADRITPSMRKAIGETNRRREIQLAYNKEHNIIPQTIRKEILKSIEQILQEETKLEEMVMEMSSKYNPQEKISVLEEQMTEAAKNLDFEYAAILRDRISELKGEKKTSIPKKKKRKRW